MKTGSMLLGIVGGLAAGAILGILYAPDKGCNTRKKISKKGSDIKESLKDSFDELVSNVEEKYNDLASKASSMADKAGNMADDASENIQKMNRELKR